MSVYEPASIVSVSMSMFELSGVGSSLAGSQKVAVDRESRYGSRFADIPSVASARPLSVASAIPIGHFDDPNFDEDDAIAGALDDDSPYPEVRSAVANTDDQTMPVSTFRSWVIGFTWAIIVPALNQFFYFRYPTVQITSIVAQLLSYPMGRCWARVMPDITVFGVAINPGPFTIKEHVLVTIMANVGYPAAYAIDIIAVQRIYYHQVFNFSYQWMIVQSTQLIGFSLGGILRRFLVQPPSMIWPANLVTCALFNTLHSAPVYAHTAGKRGSISRERFFVYVFFATCAWNIFPGYLFQALSYFSWVCWLVPDNVVVNQLFGYRSGLGMSLLTFDWAQISYIGTSPLATPWWAEANVLAGFIMFYWILTPILYYTNTWYAGYLPILSRSAFDNTGAKYNFTAILAPDNTLNVTAYEAYSPLFLSTTFAISYGLTFASITATVMHAILFFRKQIWVLSRRSRREQTDIHGHLMSKYHQVPEWWYLVVFVVMFSLGVISIRVWPTDFPVWGLVFSIVIASFYTIPIGMIQAITNQQVGLNVLTELVIGYAIPGRPVALMLFKSWGFVTLSQALRFTSDFKLGHYMKIPPRTMFWAQISAGMVAGTVQLGVQAWMFSNIPDICSSHQPSGFVCPNVQVFGTASIIWGLIGPARQFSSGQIYSSLKWFFLLGALCPIGAWVLSVKWPHSFIRYVNFPIIFAGTYLMPPATALNYVPWAIIGFAFQFIIRRRHFYWWMKYNYVLSAALDSGVAISIVLIFFFLQYPKDGTIGSTTIAKWWGNTVYMNTADGRDAAYLPIPDSGAFGPATW